MEGFSLVPREEKKPRGWSGVVTQKNSILIGHVLNERRTGTTHDHKALGVVLRD